MNISHGAKTSSEPRHRDTECSTNRFALTRLSTRWLSQRLTATEIKPNKIPGNRAAFSSPTAAAKSPNARLLAYLSVTCFGTTHTMSKSNVDVIFSVMKRPAPSTADGYAAQSIPASSAHLLLFRRRRAAMNIAQAENACRSACRANAARMSYRSGVLWIRVNHAAPSSGSIGPSIISGSFKTLHIVRHSCTV